MVNHLARSILLVCHTGGVNSSLTMCRLNLNLKILRRDPGLSYGGSIIFDHVQAKSELKNFKVRSWSVIWVGGSIIFDHVQA